MEKKREKRKEEDRRNEETRKTILHYYPSQSSCCDGFYTRGLVEQEPNCNAQQDILDEEGWEIEDQAIPRDRANMLEHMERF